MLQILKRLLLAPTLLLAACSSHHQDTNGSSVTLPDWVASPQVKDGIAATSCVNWSGHLDIDKKQAVANARQELAQQIRIRIKSLDETYARKTQAQAEDVTGGVFESVSRQVVEESLTGSVPEKVAVVKIADKEQLCALVSLQPERTRALFSQLLSEARVTLAAQDDAALYEEFKAYKAQDRLDRTLEKDSARP